MIKIKSRIYPFIAVLAAGLTLGYGLLQAAEASYDRYASLPRVSEPRSSASKVSSDFLTYPLELLRIPASKSLYLTEKYHLDNKAKWAYDKLTENGLTPKVGLFSVTGGSGGLDVDYVRLFRRKTDLPDLVAKSWVEYSNSVRFDAGSELGWQDISGTGVGSAVFVDYESRPEEHFYGLGPETSAGNGTSYKMETTTAGVKLNYDPRPTLKGDLYFHYKNVNITNGEDGGRGIIDEIFPAGSIPGLAGDELLVYGGEIQHDTRNQRELSTSGGLRRLGLALNDGISGSDAQFLKYQAEFSQYFALGSPRRVLAYHAYGEHNDELGDSGVVPFHQMARLGGHGLGPWLSRTLRGYDVNRFSDESSFLMNLEYRYTVWESKNFRMDTVTFADLGQVFAEFHEFEMDNFRESYGGGFRFSVANHMLLGIEVAHGDEGTNLYVRTSTPF